MKRSIVEFLTRAYEEERAFLTTLSDQERSTSGSPQHWSAKDLVLHLAVWKERMALALAAAAKGKEPAKYGDIDVENAAIFDQHRNLSWEETRNKLERAQAELIEQTQALKKEDLVDAQRFTWPSGLPFQMGFVMIGYWHPMLHLAQFYYQRGEAERFNKVVERSAERLCRLDESPVWQGRMIYDLACYYALTGQQERAIAQLREALRLDPGLTEWSRRDTDLISIRDDPAYEALYAT